MDKEQQEKAERFWRQIEAQELAKFSDTLGGLFKQFEGMNYDEVMAHIRDCHMKLLRKEKR